MNINTPEYHEQEAKDWAKFAEMQRSDPNISSKVLKLSIRQCRERIAYHTEQARRLREESV